MRKRFICALLFALGMVVCTLFVPPEAVRAASATITVAADKTEADPGDTIGFTVTLGPVSNMGTMQMVIVIPDGLTYVQGSGAIPSDLRTTLGFDLADFTEISMMVNGAASKGDYSSEEDTLLCTFSCTVNKDFHGTAEVGLTELEFYSCRTWQDHTSEYSVVPAVITVAGADTEEETAGPAETTTASDSTEPSGKETTGADQSTASEQSTESSVKPTESTSSKPQPAESTQGGTPVPGSSGESSSEAAQSGESSTEEQPESPGSDSGDESTAPENTDTAKSSEAAVSTEGQNSAGTESTASEADTKDYTDKAGTKPVESDKDKNDPDGGKDSSRKSGWIWFAAAALAVFAGTFFMIFLNRRRQDEVTSERGRSRKKVK